VYFAYSSGLNRGKQGNADDFEISVMVIRRSLVQIDKKLTLRFLKLALFV